MSFPDIPVIMYGVPVGTMTINDDGSLDVNITDTRFTLDWSNMFAEGGVNVVQIAPYYMSQSSPGENQPPTPPSPPATE